jgi:hypothetical protein
MFFILPCYDRGLELFFPRSLVSWLLSQGFTQGLEQAEPGTGCRKEEGGRKRRKRQRRNVN